MSKNYSLKAISRNEVKAINTLNCTINKLYNILSAKEFNLFFEYAAAFVDNNGSPTENATITEDINLDLPDYQKYKSGLNNDEHLEALLENKTISKPVELTRITNDTDLKRILGYLH